MKALLWWGATIFVVSWLPLLLAPTAIVGDNPIGLGLLAWFGSFVGLLILAAGMLAAVFAWFSRN